MKIVEKRKNADVGRTQLRRGSEFGVLRQLIGSAEPKVVLEPPKSKRFSGRTNLVDLAQINRSVDVVVSREAVTRAMLALADAERWSENKRRRVVALRHNRYKISNTLTPN